MSKKNSVLHSWQEFDACLKEIAQIDARVKASDSKRQLQIIEIEAEFSTATQKDLKQKLFLEAEMEAFYLQNRRGVEESGKKSIELRFGKAGMRLGTRTLKLLRGWDWSKVCIAMLDSFNWENFIVSSASVDKNAVKAAEKSAEELAEVGVKIGQKEAFFYETYPEKAAEVANV